MGQFQNTKKEIQFLQREIDDIEDVNFNFSDVQLDIFNMIPNIKLRFIPIKLNKLTIEKCNELLLNIRHDVSVFDHVKRHAHKIFILTNRRKSLNNIIETLQAGINYLAQLEYQVKRTRGLLIKKSRQMIHLQTMEIQLRQKTELNSESAKKWWENRQGNKNAVQT